MARTLAFTLFFLLAACAKGGGTVAQSSSSSPTPSPSRSVYYTPPAYTPPPITDPHDDLAVQQFCDDIARFASIQLNEVGEALSSKWPHDAAIGARVLSSDRADFKVENQAVLRDAGAVITALQRVSRTGGTLDTIEEIQARLHTTVQWTTAGRKFKRAYC